MYLAWAGYLSPLTSHLYSLSYKSKSHLYCKVAHTHNLNLNFINLLVKSAPPPTYLMSMCFSLASSFRPNLARHGAWDIDAASRHYCLLKSYTSAKKKFAGVCVTTRQTGSVLCVCDIPVLLYIVTFSFNLSKYDEKNDDESVGKDRCLQCKGRS